jgi:serine/threonine protein kinase
MIPCASPSDLQDLLAERLAPDRERLLLAHVETCAACQEILEELTAARAPDPSTTAPGTAERPPGASTPEEDLFWQRLKVASSGRPLSLPAESAGASAVERKARDAGLFARLGRYELGEEIGRGGMGPVYRAHDPHLNRPLAVKVLLERHGGRLELEGRFLEEAQITGQLQHPGVPPVHEVGRLEDGRPFFAMKLVKGQTLDALLRTSQDPATDRPHFMTVFGQVCQALAYAHSRGVLHRDLKPANIMVGAFGEVQVMDWGLAKVLSPGRPASALAAPPASTVETLRTAMPGLSSQAGAVVGTLAYMPPEQALGRVAELDERADVFGLGAILCEILTGRPPYAAGEASRLTSRPPARTWPTPSPGWTAAAPTPNSYGWPRPAWRRTAPTDRATLGQWRQRWPPTRKACSDGCGRRSWTGPGLRFEQRKSANVAIWPSG